MVEAGLAGASVYALYKPLADKDYNSINGVISASKYFYKQSGYIFVLLVVGFTVIYPLYIRTALLPPLFVGILVLILGVNGALEFFTLAKYRALLTADQKTYIISLASIIQIVFNTVIIAVLAYFRINIVLLRFISLFSIFLRSFILMTYCKKNYNYLNYKALPNKEAVNKRWDALYLQILGAVHNGTPVVLITLILKDLKIVSVYTIYYMIIVGIGGIFSIFISGLAASFGDVIAKGEIKTLQKSYKEFEFAYYSLITVVYSITFITIMPFINIYTKGITDINYNLPVVGFLFVLNGLLYNIKTPQGMLVISAGLYKETKLQTTIQGLIAVVVGVILAPFFGISGILIGSILSNIYRDIDLMIFIPKHVTKTSISDTFLRIIRILVATLTICLPFTIISVKPDNYLKWFAFAFVVGLYAVLVVIIISYILDRNKMKSINIRLLSIIGTRK